MNTAYAGLRHGGGTSITRCCGCEALTSIDPDRDYVSETDDGTPITTDEFPDADFVCPKCERTWPDGCGHNEVDLLTATEHLKATDGTMHAVGRCQQCDARMNVLFEVADITDSDVQ